MDTNKNIHNNKKFRAWYRPDFDTPDGPMKFVQEITDDDILFVHGDIKYGFEVPFLDPDWIVEQWTTLVDNQGVDIYEGDLISVANNFNIFEVKFGKINRDVLSNSEVGKVWPLEFNGFYFEHVLTKLPCLSIIYNDLGVHDITMTKVVGNIHKTKIVGNIYEGH